MEDNRWPRRRRLVSGTLRGIGLIAVLAGCAWSVFALQPFGDRGWTFGAIFAASAWLATGLRGAAPPEAARTRGVPTLRGVGHTTRAFLVAGLAAWMALIAWSAFTPGGPMPPPKSDPAAIRVLSWNILLGADGGLLWGRHGWPVRRPALLEALQAAGPDILCVQEALAGQVKLLEAELPRHSREGVGRDDGRTGGEHCAILFDASRFERLDGGTFWLEEPADAPPARPGLSPKRICTWVRLRDRPSGRTLRVYNAHSYLTEEARLRASRIILARIGSGDATDEVLLAGDFNALPAEPSRGLFSKAGLIPTAESAGGPADAPTYQFYGIRWRSLDEIYASGGWRSRGRWVVDAKPGNTFPSDHFGVLADLTLER
jgi:endonuclease/exonuclease/phosphatase family metal-dependent hydrolase